MTLRLKGNRRYPSLPSVGVSVDNHTAFLQIVKEALEISQRRTTDLMNSHVRVQDLIDLGLITIEGNTTAIVGADLSQIANIGDLTGAAEGDFLRFRSGEWVNDDLGTADITQVMVTQHQAALSIAYSQLTGTPAIPSELDDLTDVNASSPATGDVLTFDGAEWVPEAPTGGGSSTLSTLNDVDLYLPSAGDILTFDGYLWTNQQPASSAGIGSIVYQDGTVPAGNTVANTTAETTLDSQYLFTPAHLVLGTVVRFRAQGVYSTHSSAPTLKFRFKLNSVTILETPAFTTGTSLADLGWSIDGNFIITTAGSSGEIEAQGLGFFGLTDATGQTVFLPNTAKVSINLTSSLTFAVSAQWGTADAANTLTMRQLIINEEFLINDEPAPAWTPADTTTQLWLDANDATTITIATGVSQWDDKSGNGRNVVQATSAQQPTHGVATLDSKPVVNFDGSNDRLVGTTALTGLLQNVGAATIYIVRSFDTSGSGFPVMIGIAGNVVSGSNARAAFYLSVGESGNERQWGQRLDADTGQSQLTGAQPGAGVWGIAALQYEYSVAQISCFKNGTQTLAPTAFQTAGVTSNTAPAAVTIGSWPDETLFLDGSIAEIVITHTVDATERQKIEGYLAWKWGLESLLPGGHPYESAPP
jgi:hypothetical protein